MAAGAAVGAFAIILCLAPPADAHTIGGVQPSNYRSELAPVSPPIEGVTMRLLDLGRRVRLTSAAAAEIVVLGYSGEPYLRVGPRGVFENTHSPTVYINRPTTASSGSSTTTTLPLVADALAPPAWRKVDTGRSVTWRDQRTRWEGATPDAVRSTPDLRHVVRTWTLFLQEGNNTSTVVSRIEWVPPPNALPWVALAGGLFAATLVIALTTSWAIGLAAAVAFLVANDIVHSFAVAMAAGDPLPLTIGKVLLGGFYGTIAWVVGVVSIRGLLARDDTSVLLAGIVGFFIALLGGATDAAGLGRSQLIFSFPFAVARAEVAVSLGVGLGLAAAAAWLLMGPRLAKRSAATANSG